MNLFYKITCILLVLAGGRIADADVWHEKTLRVRGDADYHPYEFTDSGGNPSGFNVDLFRAVAEVMGLEADIRLGPWPEVRASLENGETDMLTGMYYSENRQKQVDFSTPFILVSQSLFVREDSPLRTLRDIEGKEILVQQGDIMHDFVMENRISDHIHVVETQKEALKLLDSGKYDCALLARLQGLYNIYQFGLTRVRPVGPPLYTQKYCFAVRKGDRELLTRLNEGLSILKATGRYEEIYIKWFGVYDQQSFAEKAVKYLVWILIPLGLVTGLSSVWFWSLRKKVASRTRALQKSREQLRQVIDLVPHMICARDIEGRFILVNQATACFYGSVPEKLVGICQADLIGDRNKACHIMKDDAEVIRSGSPKFEREMVCVDADGKEHYLQTVRIPFQFDDKAAVLMVAMDITDLKDAEREKKCLQERLVRSQKMEALGLLAGGVAHDLNNVLSGIVSYPDLILMEMAESHPLRTPISRIRESGQKAAAIVEDLLTLARRGVVSTKVVNLNDIVNDYLASPEYEKLCAEHPGLQVHSRLDPNLFNIKGSPVHLRKTVMNLMNNAAESQMDEKEIVITTFSRYVDRPLKVYQTVREGDFSVLTVQDRGCGISPEDQERIFEPFYTRKVMGRSGTGLGMSVVWGTIQDHNGYILLNSSPGAGTVFQLYFPAVRDALSMEAATVPFSAYTGKGERVLVVDDVQEQRDIAARILTRLNYSVASVESGEAAISWLKENRADLLLLDMIMNNGLDGLETYRRIAGFCPGQKAVIASGFAETDRVREAQRLGAGGYIRKPYTLEQIGLVVRQELDRTA